MNNYLKASSLKFFFQPMIRSQLINLNNYFDFKNNQYFVTIKKITDFFGEKISEENVFEDVVEMIFNFNLNLKQPFNYSKNTIRLILHHFLPFSFFFTLNYVDVNKVISQFKKYDDGLIHTYVKKSNKVDFAIVTWTSNFYQLNWNYYSNFNLSNVYYFFNQFFEFAKKHDFILKNVTTKQIIDKFGTNPIVLIRNLKLDHAIVLLNYLTNQYKKLPFDFLIVDARALERQKNQIKPFWIC